MSFEKSCKFYQDSKCMLKGGCCDLNCELTNSDRGDQFYDEIDTFRKWRIEKAQKKKNSESKLGWGFSFFFPSNDSTPMKSS